MIVDFMIENDFLEKYYSLTKKISSNKEYGFDQNLEEFIKAMSLLKPQSYGKRIENRIIQDLNNKPVSPKEDKGDMVDNNGQFYEIKTSLITETNNALNLVQIRLWQEIDYYFCLAFDLRNLKDIAIHQFMLTKEQMTKEMLLLNATSAHGTKSAIKENKTVELRYSLKIDEKNEVFKRWKKDYSVKII